MYKNIWYRGQFWTDFHEIRMLDAGPPTSEPNCCWKQSAQQNHRYRRKCAPKTSCLAFIQPVWNFLWKKLTNNIWYLIPPQKKFNSFLSATLPQKWSCPLKIIFHDYFGKFFFFFEKIAQWKIFKTSFPTKTVILIFVTRRPLPLKTAISSHK